MLQEFIDYSLLRVPRELKATGHVKELISMKYRYKRCKSAWQYHLNKTQAVITHEALKASKKERIVILGSGLLLDVPIKRLSYLYDVVELIDIYQMPEVFKAIRRINNIDLIQYDITQSSHIIEMLKNKKINVAQAIEMICSKHTELYIGDNIDFIVSLNLMSQLSVMPCLALKKFGASEEELKRVTEHFKNDHINYLKNFKRALVICDQEIHYESIDGTKEVEIVLAIDDFLKTHQITEWFWDIAPIPEFDKSIHVKHKVGAYLFRNLNVIDDLPDFAGENI